MRRGRCVPKRAVAVVVNEKVQGRPGVARAYTPEVASVNQEFMLYARGGALCNPA